MISFIRNLYDIAVFNVYRWYFFTFKYGKFPNYKGGVCLVRIPHSVLRSGLRCKSKSLYICRPFFKSLTELCVPSTLDSYKLEGLRDLPGYFDNKCLLASFEDVNYAGEIVYPVYRVETNKCYISGSLAFTCKEKITSTWFQYCVPLGDNYLYKMIVSTNNYPSGLLLILCRRQDKSFCGSYNLTLDAETVLSKELASLIITGKLKQFFGKELI